MKLRNIWVIAFLLASCSCQNVVVETKNPLLGKCFFRQPTTLQRLKPGDIRSGEAKLFIEKGRDFQNLLSNGMDHKPETEVRDLKKGCIFKLNRIIVSEAGVGTMADYELLAMNKDCEVDHYYLMSFYFCEEDTSNPKCEFGKADLKEVPCPR